MNEFEEYLGMGGQFVVKQEGGKVLLVSEVKIDGKKYHSGYILPDKIKTILEGDCSIAAMRAVNRIKKEKKNG